MRAWVRSAYGGPEVLRLEQLDEPTPGPGEVVVRVHAASLNRADLDYLYGWPAIARLATGLRAPRNRRLGLDVAGSVEAVGAGVDRIREGDAVFGDLTSYGYGAFADRVSAPQAAFAPMPRSMSFEEAATVPQSAVLALQGLRKTRPVEPGDRVLVNGASGNVGPFAVQIAKAMGAEVTGVCSAAKVDLVESIGADHVIDYGREDFARSGARYDRIVDVVARRPMLTIHRCLRPGGVYAWIGGSMASLVEVVTLAPLLSLVSDRSLGLFLWRPFGQEDVDDLTELIDAGSVRAVIDRRYPLEGVPDALRYLDEGQARGKVVITVRDEPPDD